MKCKYYFYGANVLSLATYPALVSRRLKCLGGSVNALIIIIVAPGGAASIICYGIAWKPWLLTHSCICIVALIFVIIWRH